MKVYGIYITAMFVLLGFAVSKLPKKPIEQQ